MPDHASIQGRTAPLRIANLDTDQIMPKQFLRGIDKAGLDRGLLHDLRFDEHGRPREEFVLNRPQYAHIDVLIAGPNFGCGSSREHAVWGLQQFGIEAIIAPSYGEIFYSNAMNNRLMLVALPDREVEALMREAEGFDGPMPIVIDVENLTVTSASLTTRFQLAERHRRMFLDGLDVIGASLTHRDSILAFAEAHCSRQPWLKDLAQRTCERLAVIQDEPQRPACTPALRHHRPT